MPNNKEMTERFWEKVDVRSPDECWEWIGATKSKSGYGVISVPGHNRIQLLAHRVSAAIHFGMFSRLDLVCHHCDNPPCVNPAHLYLGDSGTNAADMMRRGRGSGQFQPQTHCHKGHAIEGDNVYVNPGNGARTCYACKRERWLKGHSRDYYYADDVKAAAVVDYANGLAMSLIQSKYGAAGGTVVKWARDAGVPVRRVGAPAKAAS